MNAFKPSSFLPRAARSNPAIGFGTNFAGGMMVLVFLGYWIDQKTGHFPAFTVGGSVLGLFYGGYELWKVLRILERQNAEAEAEKARTKLPSEDVDVPE